MLKRDGLLPNRVRCATDRAGLARFVKVFMSSTAELKCRLMLDDIWKPFANHNSLYCGAGRLSW